MQINILDSFLDKYIDGYLLSDIKTIKDKIPRDNHPGNASYLMTSALCSGIEFLGFLLRQPQEGQEVNGSFAFEHYCKNYLKNIDSRYEAFGIIGRELIRNGIAHSFVTKGKVGITRRGDRDDTHLVRYADKKLVIINPDFLYEDFKKSYLEYAKPRLAETGDLRNRAETNYQRLKDKYNEEIDRIEQATKNKLDDWPWLYKDLVANEITMEIVEENGTEPMVS
ncbi:MAG: hypothetical protein WD467_02760 [Candidatus Saccharimonadales bacterium]